MIVRTGEAARVLGVSQQTVRNWLARASEEGITLYTRTPGGHRLVDMDAFLAWLEQKHDRSDRGLLEDVGGVPRPDTPPEAVPYEGGQPERAPQSLSNDVA